MPNDMEKIEQKGVILIPDFSGFTDFVLSHSLYVGGYITEKLLSSIIDNNTLEFEISEIEGDAVLFYKYGEPSDMTNIIQQAMLMKSAFGKCLEDLHQQLKTKILLSLKFIVHYGTFSTLISNMYMILSYITCQLQKPAIQPFFHSGISRCRSKYIVYTACFSPRV